jgi:WD40 repeat protein
MNTFEITIERQNEGIWPVVVRHQAGLAALTSWVNGKFTLDLNDQKIIIPAQPVYGRRLGIALFHDEVRDAFVRALAGLMPGEALEVLLIIEAEDLRGLHWEQLQAPFDLSRWDVLGLNQRTPFSLYLPSQIDRRFPPLGRQDLRTMILIAGMEDLADHYRLAPFDISATAECISISLGEIPSVLLASKGNFNGPPTLDSLVEQLTGGEYSILHVVCHGMLDRVSGETILFFPKDSGGSPVPGTELIERLNRLERLPQLIILSSCESAAPNAEQGLGGLAQRLVRELGIPAVIAMTDRISIQTAQAMITPFYHRLIEHGQVSRALVEACSGLQGRYDITVPALFNRLGGRPLFADLPDRPLTVGEIRRAAKQLTELVTVRAPVLGSEASMIQEVLLARTAEKAGPTVSVADDEYQTALNRANQLCGEVLDLSFQSLAAGKSPQSYDARCPFRGLYPFREEDRDFFFGREELVQNLEERIRAYPFLAVLGPSGSGKSSLVLAGLLPVLNVPASIMTPGTDPLASLKAACTNLDPEAVLVVDQFEELFTQCADPIHRQSFIERMLDITANHRVILTMRADFWGECASFQKLKEEMRAHQELIGPMTAEQLRSAVEHQTGKVGLRFEADLAQVVIDAVSNEPGAMPLLQHALLLLWNRRHGRWLRAEEFRKIGGVQKAIAVTAEEVFHSISAEGREHVRDIFIRLTRLDENTFGGVYDTRRRTELNELMPAGSDPQLTVQLVNQLADARLLVTSVNPVSGLVEVDVAHEALIRYWPRLRTWLEDDRASLQLYESIRQAARAWNHSPKDEELILHRGSRSEEAERLIENPRFPINAYEKDYIQACANLRERDRRAEIDKHNRELNIVRLRTQRLLAMLIGVVAVTIVAVFLGIRANSARIAADDARATADAARLEAEAQSRLATSRQLANLAVAYRTSDPQLGLLLAIQAVSITFDKDKYATLEADSALRSMLGEYYRPVALQNVNRTAASNLTFSLDGKKLSAAGPDGNVRVWDTISGVAKDFFHNPSGPGRVAFSPDGKLLAFANQNTPLLIKSLDEKEQYILGQPLEAAVQSVVFSPDGTTVSIALANGFVRTWNLSNRGQILEVQVQQLGSVLLEYQNNGKALLISPNHDGLERINLTGNPTEEKVVDSSRAIDGMLQSLDGLTLAVWFKDETLEEHDLASLALKNTLGPFQGNVLSASYNPSGLLVVLVNENTSVVSLLKIGNNTETVPLIGRSTVGLQPNLVLFSRDGLHLFISREDNVKEVWNTRSGDLILGLGDENVPLTEAVFDSTGDQLAVRGQDGGIRLWRLYHNRTHIQLSGLPTNAWRVVYDRKGDRVAAAGQDGIAIVWDPATGEEISRMIGHQAPADNSAPGINSLVFDSSGDRLATAGWDGTGRVWDTHTGKQLLLLAGHTKYVSDIAFSPDGRLVATVDMGGHVFLWDATSGIQVAQMQVPKNGSINRIAFSPDGARLAGAGTYGSSSEWNVPSKSLLFTLANDSVMINPAFSPDGKRLVFSGFEGQAFIVDAVSGKILHDISDPQKNTIMNASFSHDGSDVMTVGEGGVHLWDSTSGTMITTFRGHIGRVWGISADPTSDLIATGGEDGTIRIWNLHGNSPVSIFPDFVGVKSLFNLEVYRPGTVDQSYSFGSAQVQFHSDNNTPGVISSTMPLKLPWVMWLSYSPDGKYLASASMDGSVDLYLTDTSELLRLAKLQTTRDFTCEERIQFLYENLVCPTETPELTPTVP